MYAQDPEAGIKLRPGNTVTISVSAGIGKSKVPDVRGLSINDATLAMEEAGFVTIPKEEEHDTVAKDKVTRTNPRSGTQLARGSKVEVYVSLGPSTVMVLNVNGLKDDVAIAQLSQADFNVVTQEEASDTVAVGLVIRTDPVANTRAPRASTVTIFVSTGPSMVAVPNVTGKTESEAISMLQNAISGVVIIKNYVIGTPLNHGTVKLQIPAAGTKVAKGTQVIIDIFTAP